MLRGAWQPLALATVAAAIALIGSAMGAYHPLLPAALSVPLLGLLLALAGARRAVVLLGLATLLPSLPIMSAGWLLLVACSATMAIGLLVEGRPQPLAPAFASMAVATVALVAGLGVALAPARSGVGSISHAPLEWVAPAIAALAILASLGKRPALVAPVALLGAAWGLYRWPVTKYRDLYVGLLLVAATVVMWALARRPDGDADTAAAETP